MLSAGTRIISQGLAIVSIIIAIAGGGAAVTAEKAVKVNWKAQVSELSRPADGDVLLTVTGDALWKRSFASSKDPGLQGLLDVIRSSDSSFTNFEQAMADSGMPWKEAVSKVDPSIISDFVSAGVDLVSLANNHVMDFGPTGLDTTTKTLEQNGIKYSGAGRTLAEALKPAIIEKKGLKVALLAFMVAPNFDEFSVAATQTTPGTAPIRGTKVRTVDGKSVFSPSDDDLKVMEGAIKEARKSADFVAVSMHVHWPGEENDRHGRQLIAHAAIDAGADAVFGHGPRVLNGIEFYKNQPIIYNPGPLAFQLNPVEAYELFPTMQKFVLGLLSNPKHFEAVAVRMTLSREGKLRRMELLPVGLNDAGEPHLASGTVGESILSQMKMRSESLGTTINRQSWYGLVELPNANAAQ